MLVVTAAFVIVWDSLCVVKALKTTLVHVKERKRQLPIRRKHLRVKPIISITNMSGQVISWSSAGKMGFRGSKKNTPYAAQMAAGDCAKVAYDLGLRKVKVYVKGPGSGRESSIRTINSAGIEVTEIVDVTPLPHNGCRPPKRRRI